jgi:hypothetical protein
MAKKPTPVTRPMMAMSLAAWLTWICSGLSSVLTAWLPGNRRGYRVSSLARAQRRDEGDRINAKATAAPGPQWRWLHARLRKGSSGFGHRGSATRRGAGGCVSADMTVLMDALLLLSKQPDYEPKRMNRHQASPCEPTPSRWSRSARPWE